MDGANATRERLLQAAVQLLGRSGVQSVTHRSVEDEAGVARGSTRYWFGTREDLLAAVLAYMAREGADVMERAAESVDGATLLPGVMDEQTQGAAMRSMTAAMLADPVAALPRFELFLYACRRPELAEVLTQWRGTFLELSAAHLAARGAKNPEAGARMTVAALDGLILHALTAPHDDFQRYGPTWMAQLAELALELD